MDALNLYLQNYVMELERDELEKRQANNGFSLKDLREETSSTSTSSSFLVFMREEILHSNLKESTLKKPFVHFACSILIQEGRSV